MGHTVNVSVEKVRGETVEKMIKRFQKKCRKEGIMKEIMAHRFHKKPSVKRREKKEEARRRKYSEERKEEMKLRKDRSKPKKVRKKVEKTSYKDQLKEVKTQLEIPKEVISSDEKV